MSDETRRLEPNHAVDIARIPVAIRHLAWEVRVVDTEWADGERLLVAVPICKNSNRPEDGWYYEFSVVQISCDNDDWTVRLSTGDDWGWSMFEVDFFVRFDR
jgi:hypothetical protein